jgi:hypothetical protein
MRTCSLSAPEHRSGTPGGPLRRASLAVMGLVACAACGAGGSCGTPAKATGRCPDLTLQHRSYVEWREVHPRGILQEVGDAYYPACTRASACGGDPLDGMGATDVWQYADVDVTRAVIGLRRDTHTYVVFVRVGVDPSALPPPGP